MAWLVGDGFDFYNAIADAAANAQLWQSVSQCILINGGRFGTGNCILLGNNSLSPGNMSTIQFTNSSTIFVNANIISQNAHVAGGTTQEVGFTWRDGGSIQGGFWLRNGGDFVVTSGGIGGTVLGSPSAVLMPLASTWAHIQVKIVVHNTTGSVELRINGSTTANYTVTGINTRNGTSNLFANVINLAGADATNNLVDDFYVFNDQGAQPNTFQGDVHAIQQFPTTDTSITWTRNTGTNNCLAVDDPRQNGDTDYVATNVVNNVDTYALTSLSPTPTKVVAVCPRYLVRMDDAGPHTVNASITSGGNTTFLPNYTCTNTYTYQQIALPQDPNGNIDWTSAAVNAALLSIKDVL